MPNDYVRDYAIDYTRDHTSIMISNYANSMLVVMLLNALVIIIVHDNDDILTGLSLDIT